MAEPFKNLFSRALIDGMGDHLARCWAGFDRASFIAMAAHELEALELKQRSDQITRALAAHLPKDFTHAADVLLQSLAPDENCDINMTKVDARGLAGWAIMPMADYVALHGQGHFDLSLELLKEMTKRASAEFAIRHFLVAAPKRTLAVLETWTTDPSKHVRRLVSEGSRPRLPWGMRLPVFIDDPAPVLRILETLKDDGDEYVRRSVANNLNDIAKDHADLVADIAGRWLKNASNERQRLVRHALRTLIKQGHAGALAALGCHPPAITLESLKITTPNVVFGDALVFDLALSSRGKKAQKLIIDYAVHHVKANGSTKPKVFKWKTVTLQPGAALNAQRKHAMRKITTRTYYPGTHRLEILVNGVSLCIRDFELVM